MAGKTAILAIDILADARDAQKGLDDTAKSASNAADKIDTAGGRAGDTSTALSALAGALEAAGFGPFAAGLQVASTALDAAEGATILFRVASETLTLSTLKDTAARAANTVATAANTAVAWAAQTAAKAWAAAQWLLNAALTANPIGLVIAGIVLLIGVIVLIVSRTKWFQDAWSTAWAAIKDAAAAVWDWLKGAATAALAFVLNLFHLYVGLYVGIWNGIRAAFAAVWDWLKGAAETALAAILAPIQAVERAFQNVVDAVRSVIEWLGRIKIPDVLKNIGDTIGGIFGRSAAATSTAGGLTVASGVPRLSGTVALPRLAARAGGAGVTIVVQGALDPDAVARQIRSLLVAGDRRRAGVRIA